MWINLMLRSFLIVLISLALDLALQLLAAILRRPSARPHNSDRLASQSWSRLSPH
jgi:hypothetical protein